MKGRGARQIMANQCIKASQKCVRNASDPRKATLTDVGWTLGTLVVLAFPLSRLEGGPVQ